MRRASLALDVAPAAKSHKLDALSTKTVTRETLVRYTFKSVRVNGLIDENM
jgi:hypothetical protein